MIVIDASILAKFILKEPSWKNISNYIKESMLIIFSRKLETVYGKHIIEEIYHSRTL